MAIIHGLSADWLAYDDHGSTSGQGVVTYATIENNNGRNNRTATSKITGSSDECTVNIAQSGRPLYVMFEGQPATNPEDASYSIGNAGGNVIIHGRTNAVSLTFSIGNGAFITLDSSGYCQYSNGSPTGGYIVNGQGPVGDPGATSEWEFCMVVAVAANTDVTSRTGYVHVIASDGTGTASANAYINQAAADGYVEISLSQNGTYGSSVSLTFAWNSTTPQNVYVRSNEQWTVTIE